jgi:hypothetical protein
MATSVYFTGSVKSEQNLYEDLIIESLQLYGQDIVYIPRKEITHDEILNESYSKFTDIYQIEMYIENQDGFEGDGDLLSKFGLEIRDQATFIVSKRRWEKQVGTWGDTLRPMEGDLLFLPMANSIFEIRFVEHESPFYQLQNVPVYKLQAELFEYSDEVLDTGIGAIDKIETVNATAYSYLLISGSGGFIIGETVSQWSGAYELDDLGAPDLALPINIEGEVASWEDTGAGGNLMVVSHGTTDGKFRKFYADTGNLISGTESGATYECAGDLAGSSNFNDSYADNDAFEYEADSIIDFTENNPFGMP